MSYIGTCGEFLMKIEQYTLRQFLIYVREKLCTTLLVEFGL